ncbi:hypothetical protein [Jidongwangia harbinensis]|uniref:hypothetical protein n=1 Tax=Jidongwangia harbinensis TaxID=2878561 RepID=UPI001CD981A9|nr:hypothetical protein [Jidongwangia harbinensis]MCA2211797.1 hypothetical protein [Jidongwangia harbinensis]
MQPELWLGLSIVFAGLWSGLLLTLTTILHPMFATRDGAGFAADLRRFLPVARRSPTNYVLVVGLVVAPAVAVAGLWDERGDAAFALTGAGLALTVAGPLLISRFLSEPTYDVILGWDPQAVPANWTDVRRRYFALNWVRAVLTWTAFALFLAAAGTRLR